MHPRIAKRRHANREPLAEVVIYNNGDIEFTVVPKYQVAKNGRFVTAKIEEAKKYLAEAFKRFL